MYAYTGTVVGQSNLEIFHKILFAEMFSLRQPIYIKIHSSTLWLTSVNKLEQLEKHNSTIETGLSEFCLKMNSCLGSVTSAIETIMFIVYHRHKWFQIRENSDSFVLVFDS